MSEFVDALLASGPNSTWQHGSLQLFGQFVGEWDFDWIDGKGTPQERHVPGEWLFSWALEGDAIQDVFICPSRAERAHNPQPDAEYGTTLRVYNPVRKYWEVCYGCAGTMVHLRAREEGDHIVIQSLDESAGINQWVFSDITPTSFHWENRTSRDGGATWMLNGELYATRRV